jgi:argininosuccinate synthase
MLIIAAEEGYEVVAFLANVGQEEDWKAVEEKALKIGAQKMIIEGMQAVHSMYKLGN